MQNKALAGTPSLAILVATGMAGTAMAETESSKARGGKLYDKCYAVVGAEASTASHPLYPATRNMLKSLRPTGVVKNATAGTTGVSMVLASPASMPLASKVSMGLRAATWVRSLDY